MRARISVATGLLLAAGLISPMPGHADVPPIEELVRNIERTIADLGVTSILPDHPIDPIDPGSHRLPVTSSITITRGPLGAVVVHDFLPTDWNCSQPADPFANPFTVSCTAIVDQWTCIGMPVEAQALTPGTSVNGTVSCTSAISTGFTTWPAPAVAASTSLGDAPNVSCTAEFATTPSPFSAVTRLLSRFVEVREPKTSPGYTVTCGPDPVMP